MRKFFAVAIALMSLLMMSCGGPKTVDYPVITSANTRALDVVRVELNDSVTLLHINAYYHPGWWIKIAPETYLMADGKKYALMGAEGIVPGEEFYLPESGEAEFSLMFEPMPTSTKQFDFIEGEQEGAFCLWGIDLTGKPQPVYPDGLPEELKKEPADGPMPEPVFEIGKTTINVHLLNYRQQMGSSWGLYANTMANTEEEYPLTIDEDGNGSVTFNQYGSARFYLIEGNTRTSFRFWVAPGDTVDVYADMRVLGERAMSHRKNSDTGRQMRLFTTGRYSDLNRMQEKYADDKYGLELYTGEFADYHMTGDEYVNMVIGLYKANSDSIAAADYPEMVRELELVKLQSNVLEAVADGDHFLKHNYRNIYGWDNPIPEDSITAEFTDEHYKKIGNLFDAGNSKLLMVYDEIGSFDWSRYTASGELPKALRLYQSDVAKANILALTEADLDSLRQLSNPFFAAACDSISRNAKREAERLKNSGLVTPTPDVSADKVFDAIVAPFKGKVVLVDLWNTWCGPCRAALKHNEPLKDGELKNNDLIWIYIADETSPMPKYMSMIPEIRGLHYRVTAEQIAKIRERFKVDGIPYYILVDKKGKASGHPGFRDHGVMVNALLEALK